MFPVFVSRPSRRARRVRVRRFRKLVGRIQNFVENRHTQNTVTEYQPYREEGHITDDGIWRSESDSESVSESQPLPEYEEHASTLPRRYEDDKQQSSL
ncbi:hypothetical protein YALI2_D01086g [Yarrowia lipolytica]|nr:hypothetical protein YALI2_D01086g [Yarrowia lipolytica]